MRVPVLALGHEPPLDVPAPRQRRGNGQVSAVVSGARRKAPATGRVGDNWPAVLGNDNLATLAGNA
eukprot:2880617-Alexandrium_andersonii.AAC.1